MPVYTKIALVANKMTLRAAERSTNAKLSELEERGYKILNVQTSAHPVPSDEDQNTLRLLWLSLITYQVEETKPKSFSDATGKSEKKIVIIDEEE